MGEHYEKQMFFDLSSNTFQEKQLVDWDLSFESSDNGYGVFLNTGYDIKICKSDYYTLIEPKTKDSNFIKQEMIKHELLDGSDGKVETSAIGDWRKDTVSDGNGGFLYRIYFIQLPYGSDRFRRLQIMGVSDSVYAIKVTKLYENNAPITEINKNKAQNFTFYSFKNGGHVVDNAEPPKETWDIEFTQYKTVIPNPPTTIRYLLTGVLSNRNNVAVATDFTSDWDKLDKNCIHNYTFDTDRDAIGWDNWKTYTSPGSAGGKYVVNSKITYIIRDTDGHYYKLRFLDFYDKLGKRGNPKFEYIRIR